MVAKWWIAGRVTTLTKELYQEELIHPHTWHVALEAVSFEKRENVRGKRSSVSAGWLLQSGPTLPCRRVFPVTRGTTAELSLALHISLRAQKAMEGLDEVFWRLRGANTGVAALTAAGGDRSPTHATLVRPSARR